jgi:hypothetical protein
VKHTAGGLCLIPWLGNEELVELTLSADGHEATLDVRRDRADGRRVREVALEAASAG